MNLKKKIVIILVVGVGFLFSNAISSAYEVGDSCDITNGATPGDSSYIDADFHTCNDTKTMILDCDGAGGGISIGTLIKSEECLPGSTECKLDTNTNRYKCMPTEATCNTGEAKCINNNEYVKCNGSEWETVSYSCDSTNAPGFNQCSDLTASGKQSVVCHKNTVIYKESDNCYGETGDSCNSNANNDKVLNCDQVEYDAGVYKYSWKKKEECKTNESCKNKKCEFDCEKEDKDASKVIAGPKTICDANCPTKNTTRCVDRGNGIYQKQPCTSNTWIQRDSMLTKNRSDCVNGASGSSSSLSAGSGGGGGGGPAVETPARELLNEIDPLNESTIFGDPAKRDPGGIVTELLKYLFPLSGLLLFLMIVWGGFDMIRGASNKQTFEQGRQKMVAAIIGFILIFLAYFVMVVLEKITGFQFLRT